MQWQRLVVYDINISKPLLDLNFTDFETKWSDIEKHLLPKYILLPELKSYRPDFGTKIARLGIVDNQELVMLGVRLSLFAKLDNDNFTATVVTDFAEEPHFVSFDFNPTLLTEIISCLPTTLKKEFFGALNKSPFQAGADLEIEVNLRCHLGTLTNAEHECFTPLIIDEVIKSKFLPESAPPGGDDIPSYIYRLSKAYKIE